MKCQDCLNWFIQAENELLLLFINQNDCRETGATELQLIHSQFLQSVNFAKKKTDPGKSHTFSAALVMTYEVWQLAANCSSFSLSHRSNLMLGAKLLRHETSMWYKSSLVRRQMRKTNEGNQTRKKEKNRLSVTAWKPVPSSFFLFMLPKAERAVSVSADRIQQEPQGQEMSLLPRVSQHHQSVMTRSHTHAHTANAHSYNTETCTRAEHTSYLICFR